MIYDIIQRLNLDKHFHARLVFLVDLFVVVFASLLCINFISVVTQHNYSIGRTVLWLLVSASSAVCFFFLLRTYHSVIRRSSLRELGVLLLTVVLKNVVCGAVLMLLYYTFDIQFPHLVALLLLDVTTAYFFLVGERALVIMVYDVSIQRTQRRRHLPEVLVYGTGESSVDFVESQLLAAQYHVAGYIVPGSLKEEFDICRKRVYTFDNETSFVQVVNLHAVDAVVFVTREQMNSEKERLVRYCLQRNIRVLFAPPVTNITADFSDKKVSSKKKLRDVSIEDLLERPEIEINMDVILKAFNGKTIMVTGAAGSIGSELCRQLASFEVKKLILFDNAETPMHNLRLELEENFPDLDFEPIIGDVRNLARLDMVFRDFRPQVVFHAAAYKHVPLMEENPAEAVLANVVGSRNVADKCLEYDVEKMVMISTDKAVNPTNVMGCTKRLAEIYVQSLARAMAEGKVKGSTQFVTTRFGNVLGSNGSVIPRFREQIAKGGPVTVTHPDITRFFMTIPEACRLVMEAATMGVVNKICIFDMGKSVKISHLAERMIEMAGFTPNKEIKIEYTGLRPGEKLYEEVLATEENTVPTDHKSIRVAKVREYEYEKVAQRLSMLAEYGAQYDIPNMIRLMKHFVPEYKSMNSEFEKYDAEIEEEIIRL